MKKLWIPILGALVLSGCSGEKGGSLSVVYGITAGLSLVLLLGYWLPNKKRDPWLLLLFGSVLVVNVGYCLLSVATDLSWALHANRLSYLGSVFLPIAMLQIILATVKTPVRKWITYTLIALGVVVFLVAASPGYLDIYYRSVQFVRVEGVSRLIKEYGPLHSLYPVYLLGYFGAMVWAIVSAVLKNRIKSTTYAVILAAAVFVNIGVWMVEQFVHMDFEILSVSYIITELFLLGLHRMMAEQQRLREQLKTAEEKAVKPVTQEQLELFTAGMAELTQTEKAVFDCYVQGMSTQQVLEKLNIKENTLKFHNKNLYSKLGINSRKQLVQIHRQLQGDSK